ATAWHDLGLVLRHTDPDAAREAFETALAIRDRPGKDPEARRATIEALASLHRARGAALHDAGLATLADAVAAWAAYDEALRYTDAAHGPDAEAAHAILLDLTRVLVVFGELASRDDTGLGLLAGLDMARFSAATDRIVALMEQAGGPDHPSVLAFRQFSDQVRLAALTLSGAEDERVTLARALVDRAERAADPAALADALGRLGYAHRDAGAFDEAEAAFTRALALRESAADALGLAEAHRDLGHLHKESGRLA